MVEPRYPLFTFIVCRADETAVTVRAAFPDAAEAAEHGRMKLQRLPPDWTGVVVARGDGADALDFSGSGTGMRTVG